MSLEEGVLNGFLGVGRVRDQAGCAKGNGLVLLHELLVGIEVAAPRALDQCVVVVWSAHHDDATPRSPARFPEPRSVH